LLLHYIQWNWHLSVAIRIRFARNQFVLKFALIQILGSSKPYLKAGWRSPSEWRTTSRLFRCVVRSLECQTTRSVVQLIGWQFVPTMFVYNRNDARNYKKYHVYNYKSKPSIRSRSNSPRNRVSFMCNRRIKSIGRNLSPDPINIHFSRTIPLELILFALIASQCNPTLLPAFLQPSPKHGCYQRERMQNRKQDFRDLR